MKRLLLIIGVIGVIATTVHAASKYLVVQNNMTTAVQFTNDVNECELTFITMAFNTPQTNTVKFTVEGLGYTNILLEGTSTTMESAVWMSDGGPVILKKNDIVGIYNTVATAAGYKIDRRIDQ